MASCGLRLELGLTVGSAFVMGKEYHTSRAIQDLFCELERFISLTFLAGRGRGSSRCKSLYCKHLRGGRGHPHKSLPFKHLRRGIHSCFRAAVNHFFIFSAIAPNKTAQTTRKKIMASEILLLTFSVFCSSHFQLLCSSTRGTKGICCLARMKDK